MYDIIIVGAGTAGLTAAIYAVRAGKRVLLIESRMYGGQIVNTPQIENYPGILQVSGAVFAQNLYEQAVSLGAAYQEGLVISIQDGVHGIKDVLVQTAGKHGTTKAYPAKSVIIATGTVKRKLGVASEAEFAGKGVSYCATCDGAFFKEKSVVVAGGGNTALTDALFLAQYCSHVYLVHRRESFRGEQSILKLLKDKKNVQFILNSRIVKLLGKEAIQAVLIHDDVAQKEFTIPVSGVFVAVGHVAANGTFQDIVDLDKSGYIAAGEDCHTSTPGIFAAGDCRTKKVRQLTTAAADGAVAALEAVLYVNHLKGSE